MDMDVGIDRGVDFRRGRVERRVESIGPWYRYGRSIDREGVGRNRYGCWNR